MGFPLHEFSRTKCIWPLQAAPYCTLPPSLYQKSGKREGGVGGTFIAALLPGFTCIKFSSGTVLPPSFSVYFGFVLPHFSPFRTYGCMAALLHPAPQTLQQNTNSTPGAATGDANGRDVAWDGQYLLQSVRRARRQIFSDTAAP